MPFSLSLTFFFVPGCRLSVMPCHLLLCCCCHVMSKSRYLSLPHDTNDYRILNYIRFLHAYRVREREGERQDSRQHKRNIVEEHHQFDTHFVRGFSHLPLLIIYLPDISSQFFSSLAFFLQHFCYFSLCVFSSPPPLPYTMAEIYTHINVFSSFFFI
jgi:hypothetical protein